MEYLVPFGLVIIGFVAFIFFELKAAYDEEIDKIKRRR